MKRAKKHRSLAPPKMRNPVARSPLHAQGRCAWQDDGRQASAGENRARQAGARPGCRRMKRLPKNADTLCRSDLEQGRMREIYLAAVDAGRALNDEQLSTSLTDTLALRPKGAGWWVFAYGSLLWNPLFPVAEMRPASLRGLHRRFCLWSLASRGTPTEPGLVLGLDRGGTCRGVALRLPAPLALDELHLLWRREMVVGAYDPRWVRLDADGRELVALTFVVRRDHPQYAGRLPVARAGRGHRTARAARSVRRRIISSARASRSFRTASSIRISKASRRACLRRTRPAIVHLVHRARTTDLFGQPPQQRRDRVGAGVGDRQPVHSPALRAQHVEAADRPGLRQRGSAASPAARRRRPCAPDSGRRAWRRDGRREYSMRAPTSGKPSSARSCTGGE